VPGRLRIDSHHSPRWCSGTMPKLPESPHGGAMIVRADRRGSVLPPHHRTRPPPKAP
jgi:hypothetical protein